MKRELQCKYLSTHNKQEVFLKLYNMQQRDIIIEDFIVYVEQLMLKSEFMEPKAPAT